MTFEELVPKLPQKYRAGAEDLLQRLTALETANRAMARQILDMTKKPTVSSGLGADEPN
jgi:hypothetical protein